LVRLGKRIQALRKKKAWTQIDHGRPSRHEPWHISDVELGKREPGIITLQVIARGLDTTMSDLLKDLVILTLPDSHAPGSF